MKPLLSPNSKGSALLATLIITVLLATLIGSVLPMSLGNHRLAVQDSMNSTAFHLAEAGIEQAVFDLRTAGDPDLLATAGWTLSEDEAYFTKVLTEADFPWGLDGNRSFEIRLLMDNPMVKTRIAVLSEALIFRAADNTLESRRMVELELEVTHIMGDGSESTGNGPFRGIIVKGRNGIDSILSNGNATYRSFNSAYIGEGTYSPPYTGNASENITVGAMYGRIKLGSGQVLGNVASSAEESEAIKLVEINDRDRISKGIIGDFRMDFPEVPFPTQPSGSESIFHHNTNSVPESIGNPDSNEVQIFRAKHNVLMDKEMTVRGNVVLIVEGDINANSNRAAIKVTEGSSLMIFSTGNVNINNSRSHITLEPFSKASIVTKGEVKLSDVVMSSTSNFQVYADRRILVENNAKGLNYNGSNNAGPNDMGSPANLTLYSNSTEGINFNGNTAFSGVIYLPNGRVIANGSPSAPFIGAIVAQDFYNNGAGTFWYDEALKNFQFGGGSEEASSEVVAFNFNSIKRYSLPRNGSEVHLVQGTEHTYDALAKDLFTYQLKD